MRQLDVSQSMVDTIAEIVIKENEIEEGKSYIDKTPNPNPEYPHEPNDTPNPDGTLGNVSRRRYAVKSLRKRLRKGKATAEQVAKAEAEAEKAFKAGENEADRFPSGFKPKRRGKKRLRNEDAEQLDEMKLKGRLRNFKRQFTMKKLQQAYRVGDKLGHSEGSASEKRKAYFSRLKSSYDNDNLQDAKKYEKKYESNRNREDTLRDRRRTLSKKLKGRKSRDFEQGSDHGEMRARRYSSAYSEEVQLDEMKLKGRLRNLKRHGIGNTKKRLDRINNRLGQTAGHNDETDKLETKIQRQAVRTGNKRAFETAREIKDDLHKDSMRNSRKFKKVKDIAIKKYGYGKGLTSSNRSFNKGWHAVKDHWKRTVHNEDLQSESLIGNVRRRLDGSLRMRKQAQAERIRSKLHNKDKHLEGERRGAFERSKAAYERGDEKVGAMYKDKMKKHATAQASTINRLHKVKSIARNLR